MEETTIGIKIADGSFVPVFDREFRGKRRLVLTTVRDNQESVQIDLYQGTGEGLEGPEYIGSLVVENITPAPKGSPEVNLLVGIDDAGNLNATATDSSSGEYQSLSVSLASLDAGKGDLPDFALEEPVIDDDFDFDFSEAEEEAAGADESYGDEASFDEESSFEEESPFDEESPFGEEPQEEEGFGSDFDSDIAESLDESFAEGETPEEQEPGRRKLHGLLFAGFILLSLAALALLTYFVFRALRGPALPTLEARVLAPEGFLRGHLLLGAAGWLRRSSLR
ncbi:MAG: Hsp70 family protein [Spirochaetaceae bacterium]